MVASLRIALVGFAGAVILLAALSLIGRWFTWLNIISNFTHVIACLGCLAAAASIALRNRSSRRILTSLGLTVAIGASSLVLSVPGLSALQRNQFVGDEATKVKVIQFNLKPGQDNELAIANWLSEEQPDILIMQDLRDSLLERITAALPQLKFHCTHQCEVAMATRYTILYQDSHGRGGYGLTPATLVSLVDVEGVEVPIVATHLARPTFGGRSSPNHMVQVQSANITRLEGLLDHIARDRMIVGGDMNATPWSWAGRRLQSILAVQRRTDVTPTWPVGTWAGAAIPIDHIYAGAAWHDVEVRRGPALGSDHYPVVVTLALVAGD